MNRRYSSLFASLSLLLFIVAALGSSMELGVAASALSLVGWMHGLFAARRYRRWGWLVAMLCAGAIFLLATLQSTAQQVQIGFIQIRFLYPADAPVFLWVLPGFLLIPTVLYALVGKTDALTRESSLGMAGGGSAELRRALAAGDSHQQALNGGLILLGLFLIIAAWRFGAGGMTVLL